MGPPAVVASSAPAETVVVRSDNDRNAEARQFLQKALAVNPQSLEAHSVLAALAFLEDKQADSDSEMNKILAIAPNYGDGFRVAGERVAVGRPGYRPGWGWLRLRRQAGQDGPDYSSSR